MIRTERGPVTTGQIERALEAQPGVAEVVAVGIQMGDTFERPVAAVVLAPGASVDAAQLEAHVAADGASMAGTRVAIVPAIPRSAAGKPQRDEIRRIVTSCLQA
jgi:fatty-acyl-CoA synthase